MPVAEAEVKAAEAKAVAAPLPKLDLNSLPVRSYLDQTVVPLLLQGMNQLVCVRACGSPSPSLAGCSCSWQASVCARARAGVWLLWHLAHCALHLAPLSHPLAARSAQQTLWSGWAPFCSAMTPPSAWRRAQLLPPLPTAANLAPIQPTHHVSLGWLCLCHRHTKTLPPPRTLLFFVPCLYIPATLTLSLLARTPLANVVLLVAPVRSIQSHAQHWSKVA